MTNRIMELADRYAAICEGDGRHDEPDSYYSEQARVALETEVAKLEAKNQQLIEVLTWFMPFIESEADDERQAPMVAKAHEALEVLK